MPIIDVYLLTATADAEEGFRWRRVSDQAGLIYCGEPDAYAHLCRLGVIHSDYPAFVLGRSIGHPLGSWLTLARSMPSGRKDHLGRPISLTLLITFDRPQAAAAFFAGMVTEWWSAPAGDAQINDLVADLVRSGLQSSSKDFLAHIQKTADAWETGCQGDELRSLPFIPECRMARPIPERIRELCRDVVAIANSSDADNEWPEPLHPVAVLCENVVPERLRGVWRALSNLVATDSWSSLPEGNSDVILPANKTEVSFLSLVKCYPDAQDWWDGQFRGLNVVAQKTTNCIERFRHDFARHFPREERDLIAQLSDSNADVRCRAAEALGQQATVSDAAVNALIELLRQHGREPRKVVIAVVKALGRVGIGARIAIPLLFELGERLRDDSEMSQAISITLKLLDGNESF